MSAPPPSSNAQDRADHGGDRRARCSASPSPRCRSTACSARRPALAERRCAPNGAGRGRRPDRRALRRQRPSRPAVAVRARADDGARSRPARKTQIFYRAHEPQRAGDHRPGGVQRQPRPGRQIFQQDRVLLLHRADAEGRARRSTCRWCSSSIPQILDDPDTKDIDEITLSYTFYPVETARRGPLERRSSDNQGSRTTWPRPRTTIIIWSIPIRGR